MISMFNVGAGTAEERALPWDGFQRTLPVRPRVALAAKVVVGLGFAVVGALPTVRVLVFTTVVSVPPSRWPVLAAAVLAGAVAMTLLGLTLGNALPLKAAVAVANVLFLPMGFVHMGLSPRPDPAVPLAHVEVGEPASAQHRRGWRLTPSES